MNLKKRVTLAMVALIGLFVGMQGLIAYLSLEDQEDELVDELVMTQARALAERADSGELDGSHAALLLRPGPNLSAWLVDANGRAIPEPVPAHLASLSDGAHRPGRPAQHLHAVVQPTRAGRLYVQYNADQNELRVDQFGLYMIGLVALSIALGSLIAWQAAGWIVGPIERLTTRLTHWAPGAPSELPARTDEEGRLFDAFARVQSRFEQALAHEHEFVANVSHEIRTPLTVLRTDLEMLQLTPASGPAQQARLQRALATIDEIASALESARTLSRRKQGASDAVDLHACVIDAWASLAPTPGIASLDFRNEVAPGATVTADRHALLTILRNLIRNAVEHAAPARCCVRLTARGIEVVDDGRGIAAEDLPFVFDRYYRGRMADSRETAGDGNRGLGLAIARQVADLNGWQLQVEAAEGGAAPRGTCFILSLDRL